MGTRTVSKLLKGVLTSRLAVRKAACDPVSVDRVKICLLCAPVNEMLLKRPCIVWGGGERVRGEVRTADRPRAA